MSGHSKWHSIRHKKTANDAIKSKILTKHSKLITIAAKSGGDPLKNPALKLAIENAKADNTPNNNIDRAIKKGTGEDKNSSTLMELTYEGYGPEGIAIIIETITDNKNRTVNGIRTAFTKNNGNMGESGSVSWMFKRKGTIYIKKSKDINVEKIEEIAIENNAEDIIVNDKEVIIYTSTEDFFNINSILKNKHYDTRSELSMIPENTIKIKDEDVLKKIFTLISILEEHEDVLNVFSNIETI
jgi:YebC/PmpR family DNA-binding regulatory protein